MLNTLLYSVEIFFLIILGAQVLYFAIFSFASLFPYKPRLSAGSESPRNKIVVFIPGYKEDKIILNTAKRALQQKYPRENYEVVILADSFAPATLAALRKLEVTVQEVAFENSTKAKSLNAGLEKFKNRDYQIAVILDSDNIMAPDFLEQVNSAYNSGHRVIQGHRTAKNQETSFALLDAINEEIGNSIFRKGHRLLGISSALIGSGMALDKKVLEGIMSDIRNVAGEDKLMELKLLKAGVSIEYLPDALVYDEKTGNAKAFAKQRTRWVGAQLYFLKNYFFNGIKELILRQNISYFDKAVQMALIPKVLLIGLLSVLAILAIFQVLSFWWIILALLYGLALLAGVPGKYYNRRLFEALVNIPRAIIFMILGILRIRRKTATKFEVTEKKV